MDLLNEGDKPSQQPQQPARTAGSPAPVTDTATRVEALIAALRAAGVDITADYNDWLKVGFALAGEFGEGGKWHHVQKVKVTKMSLCPFPKMTPRKCRYFRSSPRPSTPPFPDC